MKADAGLVGQSGDPLGRSTTGSWRSMLGRRLADTTGTPSTTTLPHCTWAPWTATIGTTATPGSGRTWAAWSPQTRPRIKTAVGVLPASQLSHELPCRHRLRCDAGGVAARRRLIVQSRHPPADRRQGMARHGRRQRGPRAGRQPQVQAGVVAVDQAAQPSLILGRATLGAKVAAGAPQRQGQVVDAGPLAHEVEIAHQHRPAVAEQHVVVPEVTVDQLAGQPGDQPGLGLADQLGEFLGTATRRR